MHTCTVGNTLYVHCEAHRKRGVPQFFYNMGQTVVVFKAEYFISPPDLYKSKEIRWSNHVKNLNITTIYKIMYTLAKMSRPGSHISQELLVLVQCYMYMHCEAH